MTWVSDAGSLAQMSLTDRDRAILDFERTWWSEPGAEGGSHPGPHGSLAGPVYQLLAALIGSANAAAYDLW